MSEHFTFNTSFNPCAPIAISGCCIGRIGTVFDEYCSYSLNNVLDFDRTKRAFFSASRCANDHFLSFTWRIILYVAWGTFMHKIAKFVCNFSLFSFFSPPQPTPLYLRTIKSTCVFHIIELVPRQTEEQQYKKKTKKVERKAYNA